MNHNHVLTLADVPLEPEKLRKLDIGGTRAQWMTHISKVLRELHCQMTELVGRAVQLFYPDKNETWRARLTRRLTALCQESNPRALTSTYRPRRNKGKSPEIPSIVRSVVRAALDWLRDRYQAVQRLQLA